MSAPHPLVLASIEANTQEFTTNEGDGCGCEKRIRWHLCQYHQGMEDGIEAVQHEPTP